MAIRAFSRVLVRLLSWNIISIFGLCTILLAISSDQGRELLRISHEHSSVGVALALLLFSTTCGWVALVLGHAGAAQLTMIANESGVPSLNVLSLSQVFVPWLLGALAFTLIASRLERIVWVFELSLALVIAFGLVYRFVPENSIRRLKGPKSALFIDVVIFLIAGVWSIWLVYSPGLARQVGTISVAMVGISLWVNALSLGFIALPLSFRLPSLVLIIPLLLVGSSVIHDPNQWPRRNANLTKSQISNQGSSTVLRALNSWLAQYEGSTSPSAIPLYLVSAEGGGIRAAYWTARTLSEINEGTNGEFSRHVFVYSGVSGGSLGITTFEDAARENRQSPQEITRSIERFLGRDYLAPLISRLLITEPLWQILGHFSGVTPRDVEFEQQFNDDWLEITHSNFYARKFTEEYGVILGRPIPIMALNSTNVETGKRVIFANAAPTVVNTDFLMPLDIDEVRKMVGDVSVAEVTHLSARFPLISPPASIQMSIRQKDEPTKRLWGQAVDGGYFDNSAALFIRDIFEELVELRESARRHERVSQAGVDWDKIASLVARLRLHVLVIRNDPQAVWGRQADDYPTVVGDITRGSMPFDLEAAIGTGFSIAKIPHIARMSELFAPPETILATRDARAAATRRFLWETVDRSSIDSSVQCEIARRQSSGRAITFPLTYSSACMAEKDDYQEISLADIALDDTTEAGDHKCATLPIEDIALGWTLSSKSQETMSCLARTSPGLKDLEADFLQSK